jgi:hypothetical protein
MSPEQATGRAVDHRTDQFALGLILHEMASGRPTFRRDTPAQVLAAVIERDPEPMSRVRRDVPQALEALVGRCLQKDPAARFARTDDLAAELGTLAARARQSASPGPISVEVMPSLPARPPRSRYHVSIDNTVKVQDEDELVTLIRKGKLTGLEMVRRDDEEQWVPLFDTRVYRLEVPNAGDPRTVARMNALRALGGHYFGFIITGYIMFATQGKIPWWMGIWGVVLAAQTLGSLPALIAVFRRRPEIGPPPQVPLPAIPGVRPAAQPLPAPPSPDPSDVVAQEAARVRALIQQRGGPDAARHIAEVDGIQKMTAELAARQADLVEQTS